MAQVAGTAQKRAGEVAHLGARMVEVCGVASPSPISSGAAPSGPEHMSPAEMSLMSSRSGGAGVLGLEHWACPVTRAGGRPPC